MSKSSFPIEIATGMKVTNIMLEGENLIYEISLNPTLYDMSALMTMDKEVMKSNIKKGLDLRNDLTLREFTRLLTELNMGLCYRYKGGGRHVDIEITSEELRNMWLAR